MRGAGLRDDKRPSKVSIHSRLGFPELAANRDEDQRRSDGWDWITIDDERAEIMARVGDALDEMDDVKTSTRDGLLPMLEFAHFQEIPREMSIAVQLGFALSLLLVVPFLRFLHRGP